VLIVTRREGEELIIGSGADQVLVSVVKIDKKCGLVKIGFIAGGGVAIDREEVAEAKASGEPVADIKERLAIMRARKKRGLE
jgi:sRNA-binding carbon storage regulator CsrA